MMVTLVKEQVEAQTKVVKSQVEELTTHLKNQEEAFSEMAGAAARTHKDLEDHLERQRQVHQRIKQRAQERQRKENILLQVSKGTWHLEVTKVIRELT